MIVVAINAPDTLMDGSPAPPFFANFHAPSAYDGSGYYSIK